MFVFSLLLAFLVNGMAQFNGANTCGEARALYRGVCCGNNASDPFVETGSVVVQGSSSDSRRRLSELGSGCDLCDYELADATTYEVTFVKASLCTGTTNTGSYGEEIVCEGEIVIGQNLDTRSYDLADPEVAAQLRTESLDPESEQLYTHLMVEIERTVSIAGISPTCCTTPTLGPENAADPYAHFRFAQTRNGNNCDKYKKAEVPFFTDGQLSLCLSAGCGETYLTPDPVVKDPPSGFGGSIVGIEELTTSQSTMKVIVATASPVTQRSGLRLEWQLENSVSFELLYPNMCHVGPYYISVVVTNQ